jgi:hypothetical protein
MRRFVLLVAALAVLGVSACSGSDQSRTLPSDRAGNPTDTLSPTETSAAVTSTPPMDGESSVSSSGSLRASSGSLPPSSEGASLVGGTASLAGSGSSGTVTARDLPTCMIGTWTAPADREFANLGLNRRSDGTVRGATGVLLLIFTQDHRWIFSYHQVTLDLTVGSVDVSGPMDGTWSLAGNALTSTVGAASVKATAHLGGLTVPVPEPVNRLLRGLPPDQAYVACTSTGLQFQLPTSQGGGTATFDHT